MGIESNAILRNINRLESLGKVPTHQYGNTHNCEITSCLSKKELPRPKKVINFASILKIYRGSDRSRYLSGMALWCDKCKKQHCNWAQYITRHQKMKCLECLKPFSKIPKIDKLLQSSKRRAMKKGIEFSLLSCDIEKLLVVQSGRCALSGVIFKDNYSIDRIDSSGGYTVDNIQLTTAKVNMMKFSYDQEEFIAICKLIAENN